MTDNTDNTDEPIQPDNRLEDLQNECRLRGIPFHHKHKEAKLLELIAAKDAEDNPVPKDTPVSELTENERKNLIRKKSLRMRRVMITCNDPMKINYKGEFFMAANAQLATVKKYCPFGNTNGWYMPQILLNVIEEKQFRRQASSEQGSRNATEGGLAKAYNVVYLEDLTPEQLQELKQVQAMRATQTGL